MTINSPKVLKSRFVKSADGTEIYADAAGNCSPSVPVIVMIPGFSMVKAAFDPIFEDPKWTSNAFLVRYDPRGHGRSGKPLNDESWESRCISQDFEAVCQEFGVTEAFVMGWSLGAAHFVDIASYNTSVSISGFITVEGALCVDQATIFRISTPESFSVLAGLMQTTDVDAFQQGSLNFISWLSDRLPPDLYRALLEGVILVPRALATKFISRTHNMDAMIKKAQSGQIELLLITGRRDKLVNATAVKAVYEEIGWKNYVYQHLDDGDHMPWLSVPDEFRETVLQWARERNGRV